MKHAMIDVEALRLNQPWKAPLLEAATVIFDNTGESLASISFAIEGKDLPAWAEPDPETTAWWQAQEAWPSLQKRIFFDGVSPEVALTGLSKFFVLHGVETFWFAGPTYDQVMLESYYDHYGIERPWAYNACRDFRTIRKQYLESWKRVGANRSGLHNALDDCEFQVSVLRDIHEHHGNVWK